MRIMAAPPVRFGNQSAPSWEEKLHDVLKQQWKDWQAGGEDKRQKLLIGFHAAKPAADQDTWLQAAGLEPQAKTPGAAAPQGLSRFYSGYGQLSQLEALAKRPDVKYIEPIILHQLS